MKYADQTSVFLDAYLDMHDNESCPLWEVIKFVQEIDTKVKFRTCNYNLLEFEFRDGSTYTIDCNDTRGNGY